MEIEDYKPLFHKALIHYKKRLCDLKDDPDIVGSKLEVIIGNISKNEDDIKRILDDFDKQLENERENIKKSICLALSSYILDLENTIKLAHSKVENLNIPFVEVEKEIKTAKEARDLLCPNDWKYTVD